MMFPEQMKSQLERDLDEEYKQLPEEIIQHLKLELQNKGLQKDAAFAPFSNHSSPCPGSGPPSNCSTPTYPSTRSTWNRSMDNSNASLADSSSSSTPPVLSEGEMSLS